MSKTYDETYRNALAKGASEEQATRLATAVSNAHKKKAA